MVFLTRYKTKKYKGRYTFDLVHYKAAKFNTNKVVCSVDFVNGQFVVSETISHLAYILGISAGSIHDYITNPKRKLIRGCFIWEKGDPNYKETLLSVTEEEVQSSVNQYSKLIDSRTAESLTGGYLVKDYRDGTVKEYRYITEASKDTGVAVNRLRSQINEGTLNLVDGYSIKRIEDEREFIDHHPLKIKFSIEGRLPNIGKIVKVTDLISNTTEYYPSFPVFARSIGKDPDSLRNKFKATGLNGYSITFL